MSIRLKDQAEEHLMLLGPNFADQTPESFAAYVKSLYKSRKATGKVAQTVPRFKSIEKPTKGPKRETGRFELHFASSMGPKSISVNYDRSMTFPEELLAEWAAKLLCSVQQLRTLCEKKKFSFLSGHPDKANLEKFFK